MHVILLERVSRLGQMGDVVRVRDGYARNYLLPQGKALRATDQNRTRFESQRTHLEARNLDRKTEAEGVATKLDGQSFIVIRQAGETGQLYGSVSTRDLAEALDAGGFGIARSQVELSQPIKSIGLHTVAIALHPEVSADITVNVARSEDEAGRQTRGEDLTSPSYDDEEEAEEIQDEATEDEATEGEAMVEQEEANHADHDVPVADGIETDTEEKSPMTG